MTPVRNRSGKARLRKARVAVFVLPIVAVLSTMGFAFASQLDMSGPTRPSFAHDSRCSSESVSVEVVDSLATVQVPQECEGEQISLFVATVSGVQRVLVGTTSATVTLPVTGSEVQGAIVTASTWPLSTELTHSEPGPGPDVPHFDCKLEGGGSCEVTPKSVSEWGGVYQYYMQVESDSPVPLEWEITIDLSSPPMPFVATYLYSIQGATKVRDSGCAASPRTITIMGVEQWGSNVVGGNAGTPTFELWGTKEPLSFGTLLMQCK